MQRRTLARVAKSGRGRGCREWKITVVGRGTQLDVVPSVLESVERIEKARQGGKRGMVERCTIR